MQTWQAASHSARHSCSCFLSPVPPQAELYLASLQCGVTTSLLLHTRHSHRYLGLTHEVWHSLPRTHFPGSPAKRQSIISFTALHDNVACLRTPMWVTSAIASATPGSHVSPEKMSAQLESDWQKQTNKHTNNNNNKRKHSLQWWILFSRRQDPCFSPWTPLFSCTRLYPLYSK